MAERTPRSLARFGALLVLGIFVASVSGVGRAQDLAEAARKEKARRAALKANTKVITRVITEDDLKDPKASPSPSPGAPSASPAEEAAATPPAPASAPAVDPEAARAEWKERVVAARQAVASAEAQVKSREDEIARVRADVGPLSASDAMDPLRLQKKDQKIAELQSRLTSEKQALSDARKALDRLEEAARRAGVPPGWLR